jgi:hypothetical protein
VPDPLFEFFEVIAGELFSDSPRVITSSSLKIKGTDSLLLNNLKSSMGASSEDDAIKCAVDKLQSHFRAKGSEIPFEYDPNTGEFSACDLEYLAFVREMSNIRSIGKQAKRFECSVAERLGKRATGAIHRVGFPRERNRTRRQFNNYLRTLGFSKDVALGREKAWILTASAKNGLRRPERKIPIAAAVR